MITLNDKVKIELTLFDWHKLENLLAVCAYDFKETNPISAKTAKDFRDKIFAQLDKIDFSANEKLVDEINQDIAKKDCETCVAEPICYKDPSTCK